jgi:hypothetical protein
MVGQVEGQSRGWAVSIIEKTLEKWPHRLRRRGRMSAVDARDSRRVMTPD